MALGAYSAEFGVKLDSWVFFGWRFPHCTPLILSNALNCEKYSAEALTATFFDKSAPLARRIRSIVCGTRVSVIVNLKQLAF